MEKLTTVQNSSGDVATYLFHEEKHTLFVFDSSSNRSYVETLTKNDKGQYFYTSVSEDQKDTDIYPAGLGEIVISVWQNTQHFIDSLDWNEGN